MCGDKCSFVSVKRGAVGVVFVCLGLFSVCDMYDCIWYVRSGWLELLCLFYWLIVENKIIYVDVVYLMWINIVGWVEL